ncbi:HNH endonuclease [Thalassotalea sp. ND16A]|uniref:HNH endonuclease n=1 Tax=Thalassotalea sp. ND16A TaxID=1535422 RepID=UPI00051D5305|nr:HNH endonuclease [Thalassotalea sp. ND16A]KGJ91091.1 hypothetical protein ND16A_0167 [Thalassotalea sp. ND16A]
MFNVSFFNNEQRKAKQYKTLNGAYKAIYHYLLIKDTKQLRHVILYSPDSAAQNFTCAEQVPYQPPKKLNFYQTRAWLELRVEALSILPAKCCLCGATKESGAQLHVDHIKPRSTHPHLQLELNNLQILCQPCNIGKSNKFNEDWRD